MIKEEYVCNQILIDKRMPDEVKKFCGNCYWYDADNDHRSIGWCVERKCKTGFFSVCKDHKF